MSSSVIRREKSSVARDAPYPNPPAALDRAGVVVIDDVEGFRVVSDLGEADSLGDLLCTELRLEKEEPTCLVQRVNPVDYYSPISAYMHEGHQHADRKDEGLCSRFIGDMGLSWIYDCPTRVVIVRQNTVNGHFGWMIQQDIEKLRRRYDRFLKNEKMSADWEALDEAAEEEVPEPDYEENSQSDFLKERSLDEEEEESL